MGAFRETRPSAQEVAVLREHQKDRETARVRSTSSARRLRGRREKKYGGASRASSPKKSKHHPRDTPNQPISPNGLFPRA